MVPSLRLCALRLRFHTYRAFLINSLKGIENGKGTIRSGFSFQRNIVFGRTCSSEYKRGFNSIKFYSVDDNKTVEDEANKELDDDGENNVQDQKEILIGEAEKDSKDEATAISAVVGVDAAVVVPDLDDDGEKNGEDQKEILIGEAEKDSKDEATVSSAVVVVPDLSMKKKKIPKRRRKNLCKCHFKPMHCHFSRRTYSPPPPQPAPPSPSLFSRAVKKLPSKESISTFFTWCTNFATVAALAQFSVRLSDVVSGRILTEKDTSTEEMAFYKEAIIGKDSRKLEEIQRTLNEINRKISDLEKKVSSSGSNSNGSENGDDKEDDEGGDAGGANVIWTVLNFLRKLFFS